MILQDVPRVLTAALPNQELDPFSLVHLFATSVLTSTMKFLNIELLQILIDRTITEIDVTITFYSVQSANYIFNKFQKWASMILGYHT